MKTLLITGSGGFVGKNLKEYFSDKYNVLSPRSNELNLINEEEVKKYFIENQIDYIIHCASIGGVRGEIDRNSTISDNLKMVDNLLKFKNDNVKIILFGSGAMYDKSRNLRKIKEEEISRVIPKDLYGESKMLIAKKIQDRKDVVCLNIFACYGKNEKETRFPTYAIEQNLKKEPIIINQNVIFDYLYIEDLAKIIEKFLIKTPQENIINVTPNESISLFEISELVNEISDFKSEIIIKNPILAPEYTGDNSRLLNELPELKFTSYKDGLKILFNHLKVMK
ncbi:MAG: NAD-dependent epimerase/dehydratase family protein [Candidatus Gastranaerophilales bacterium]|nr:NAD-dependent epimerase/dehydratase family protein [Candidatus Gastranaerophilales bacterium]